MIVFLLRRLAWSALVIWVVATVCSRSTSRCHAMSPDS
jgi:hypothetical protein